MDSSVCAREVASPPDKPPALKSLGGHPNGSNPVGRSAVTRVIPRVDERLAFIQTCLGPSAKLFLGERPRKRVRRIVSIQLQNFPVVNLGLSRVPRLFICLG